MNDFFYKFTKFLGQKNVVIVLFGLTIVNGALMGNFLNQLRDPILNQPGHSNLQLIFSKEQFIQIINIWIKNVGSIEETTEIYQNLLLKFDFSFPILYSLLGIGLLAFPYFQTFHPEHLSKRMTILFSFPVVPAFLDMFVENPIHILLLGNVTNTASLNAIPTFPIQLAALAAYIKMFLIIMTVLAMMPMWMTWFLEKEREENK